VVYYLYYLPSPGDKGFATGAPTLTVHQRDVFDWLLVVMLGVLVAMKAMTISISSEGLTQAIDALVTLDVRVWLVIGGGLGILFVGYIVFYLPSQTSSTSPE
jgi:hypothetical protein